MVCHCKGRKQFYSVRDEGAEKKRIAVEWAGSVAGMHKTGPQLVAVSTALYIVVSVADFGYGSFKQGKIFRSLPQPLHRNVGVVS